jgi:hypothetical protein
MLVQVTLHLALDRHCHPALAAQGSAPVRCVVAE